MNTRRFWLPFTTLTAFAGLLLLIAALVQPVSGRYKEVTLNKFMLYEQLLIYRGRYGVLGAFLKDGPLPTPGKSSGRKNASKPAAGALPPFPGIDLSNSGLIKVAEVQSVDLPRMAHRIFAELCAGDNGSYVWGVRNGSSKPVPLSGSSRGWDPTTPLPPGGGFLVPVCMCNGQPAEHRKMVKLANFEPFVPLLSSGYSFLSSIVMETCSTSVDIHWPPKCEKCSRETTKACVVVSQASNDTGVICNCYYGFDPVSGCRQMSGQCSKYLEAQSSTASELCQVSQGNQCATDGNSYMCTCFRPYFENKTLSNSPNCMGQRGQGLPKALAVMCEDQFCGGGGGVCTAKANSDSVKDIGSATGVRCRCNPGYAGPDCSFIQADVSPWSDWSDCHPACGNTGSQSRLQECKPADGDTRFCDGVRRQHRRCMPRMCFVNDTLPVLVQRLDDQLPTALYVMSGLVFGCMFFAVYFTGLLVSLGSNFQDWKLEAVNQAGRRALAVDEACDELLVRHTEAMARLNARREEGQDDGVDEGEEEMMEGEDEDFFQRNVFVPHPIVDHLMGIRRLPRRPRRRKKVTPAKDDDEVGARATRRRRRRKRGRKKKMTIGDILSRLRGKDEDDKQALSPSEKDGEKAAQPDGREGEGEGEGGGAEGWQTDTDNEGENDGEEYYYYYYADNDGEGEGEGEGEGGYDGYGPEYADLSYYSGQR